MLIEPGIITTPPPSPRYVTVISRRVQRRRNELPPSLILEYATVSVYVPGLIKVPEGKNMWRRTEHAKLG